MGISWFGNDQSALRGVSGKGLNSHEQLDALRETIVDQIDAAKHAVMMAIEALKRNQVDNEAAESISALEQQLSLLDAEYSQALSADIGQLVALSHSVPTLVSKTQISTSHAVTEATLQQGHLVFEMTDHAVATIHAQHDQQATQFASSEQRSARRVEQLASANGIDITAWHINRERLQRQKQDSKTKGDRVAYFRADALLAANVEQGLIITGAPAAEQAEARAQAEAARQRYLNEVELQARKEAKAAGWSPDHAAQHIANSREHATADLAVQERELARQNGLGVSQIEATRFNAEHSAVDWQNLNARTNQTSVTGRQSLKPDHTTETERSVAEADKMVEAGSIDPFAAAAQIKETSAKLETAQADQNSVEPSNTPDAKAASQPKSRI